MFVSLCARVLHFSNVHCIWGVKDVILLLYQTNYDIQKNKHSLAVYNIHSTVWNFFYNLTSYYQLLTTTWLISAPDINQQFGSYWMES